MLRWAIAAIGMCGLASGSSFAGSAPGSAGSWQPAAGLKQIPIWPDGVPNMAGVVQPPESVEVDPKSVAGLPATMIHDVSVPTMTVVRPKGRNSGAAMIVFPGGGFNVLAIDLEGTEICDWVTAHGMTCVLLKYRVPGSDTQWQERCECQVAPKVLRALQDAQRTIKLTRAHAKEFGIDPGRVGVIGFSAGGYLVAQTSNIFAPAYRPVDAIDRLSSRPDFAVAAYPGHLCRDGKTLDPTIHVTQRTPPTFIVQNWDDRTDEVCNSMIYARALNAAAVPTEIHIFAKGDHAFALRRIGHPVETWPNLLESWLKEMAIL